MPFIKAPFPQILSGEPTCHDTLESESPNTPDPGFSGPPFPLSPSNISPRARLVISVSPRDSQPTDCRELPGTQTPLSVWVQSIHSLSTSLTRRDGTFHFWSIPGSSELLYINNVRAGKAKLQFFGDERGGFGEANLKAVFILDRCDTMRLKPGLWRLFPDFEAPSVRVDMRVLAPRYLIEYDTVDLDDWVRTQKDKASGTPVLSLGSSADLIGTTTGIASSGVPTTTARAHAESSAVRTVGKTTFRRIRVTGPFHGCPSTDEDDLDEASRQLRLSETYECVVGGQLDGSTTHKRMYIGIHSRYGVVAVKQYVLRPESDCSVLPAIGEMLTNEIRILNTLRNHHSIVNYLGHDTRLLTVYYEHLPHRNLCQWRDERNFFTGTERDGRVIVRDICSAVEYIHSAGITHNDINPSKILYDPKRGATLICFDSARKIDPNPQRVFNKVTPWYFPPEYIQGYRDAKGDVFALGVVLLYVLSHTKLVGQACAGWVIPKVIESERDVAALQEVKYWLREVESHRLRLTLRNMHVS